MKVKIEHAKFASELTPEEILEILEQTAAPHVRSLLEQLELRVLWRCPNKIICTLSAVEGSVETEPHALKELAALIQKVLKPGTWCTLEVRDEDGDTWGWLITEDEIYTLAFLPMVRKDSTWIPLPQITLGLEAPYPI